MRHRPDSRQSYLCILLFAYEVYSTRRKWSLPDSDELEDPWRTVFDDVRDWFTGPRAMMSWSVISAVAIATGTFYAVGQVTKSTYFCFTLVESRGVTLLVQLLGLGLDATVVVLLWRIVAWSNTVKLRLRALGTILLFSALLMSFVSVCIRLYTHDRVLQPSAGFLYGFDIVIDSLTFATLVISATFWVCETSPLTPACVVTCLVGIIRASYNVFSFGDWLHLSRASGLVPLWIIAIGTVMFAYCHDIRSIVFVRRVTFVFLLVVLLITATIFTFVKQPEIFERHPIDDFIYKARTEHDQYTRQATMSANVKAAINIYKERYDGRDPPPQFGAWYNYARGTVILDHFDQIDKDLKPFRAFTPDRLRKRSALLQSVPGIYTVTIKDGKATASSGAHGQAQEDLDSLVTMINKFAIFLPDMILPINLEPTPRVLPAWGRPDRLGHMATATELLWKRSLEASNGTVEPVAPLTEYVSAYRSYTEQEYRQLQIEACPPDSRMRVSPHSDLDEHCASCTKPHSKGQTMTTWRKSLSYCAQPDLQYLHGMSMISPNAPLIRDLLPVFGSSKTEPFSDIIIPFPETKDEKPDTKWEFSRKYDTLFWRGEVGRHTVTDQALRGSHKLRLLHLVNNPAPGDKVTMILPTPWKGEKYRYEKVSIEEANNAMPFSVGIDKYTNCNESNCELVKKAYGLREELQEPLEFRYVLLLDDDDRPPAEVVRTLKSGSVPFLSTIFQTWYTERLTPWLHFVPIDLRYQGLHSTYAYFTGTDARGKINGRETRMKGRQADADWIGQQGKRWAEKALGEKDKEVYLFRLFLEWGRLLDDKRDDIGFRVDEKGGFHNDNWSTGAKSIPSSP